MATASLLFGLLSVVGFIVVLFGVEPVLIYWLSLLSALLALVFGLMRRRERSGRAGMWLGLIGLVMGLALAIW